MSNYLSWKNIRTLLSSEVLILTNDTIALSLLPVLAIHRFIKKGKILGACLDVIENESKSFENLKTNSDLEYLKKSEKVVLTPHIAGWSIESKLKLAQVVLEKIKDLYGK